MTKSQRVQRMKSEDAIIRAKMVSILRPLKIAKDDAQMARCFKVSNEHMLGIVKYVKSNNWLLRK